jgi:hypothetical protein
MSREQEGHGTTIDHWRVPHPTHLGLQHEQGNASYPEQIDADSREVKKVCERAEKWESKQPLHCIIRGPFLTAIRIIVCKHIKYDFNSFCFSNSSFQDSQ